MIKTLRAKIILITVSMLLILFLCTSFIAWGTYQNNKRLKVEGCDYNVAYFSEQFNKSIQRLEEDAFDLSLMGEIFFNSKNINQGFLDKIAKQNFEKNSKAIGGGIWFEPYQVFADKYYFCTYSYLSSSGNVVIDRAFETASYNYPNQQWYNSIKSRVKDTNSIIWSIPYWDETGTQSLMTTVGSGMFDKNKKFIGMATVDWKLDSIINSVSQMRPTKSSFALFADKKNDFILVTTDPYLKDKYLIGKSLINIPWYNEKVKNKSIVIYQNQKYISFERTLDNEMQLIIMVPTNELFSQILHRFKILLLFVFAISLIIAIAMYLILKKNVNKPINYMTNVAKAISAGDMDAKIEIEKPQEFATLARAFNKMTQDVKDYVSHISLVNAEKERFESELNIAKSIQASSLPNVFPPYPERDEFDIYATMNTAKEVGGDFYDFFFIAPEKFIFLMADVSGKGIPAALFMMTTKTLIKNLAKTGLTPEELMTQVNHQVCKTNEQGFFVTVFMCVFDLFTGDLTCVNCGHNPPLLKRVDGSYEYFKCAPDLVIGAMDGIKYHSCKTKLNAGDLIYLYTDGVTEAFNSNGELYGELRLKNKLNTLKDDENEVENILKAVKDDIEIFSKGEEQSDDVTMLAFKYNGLRQNMKNDKDENSLVEKRFLLPAQIDKMESIIEWLESVFEEAKIPQTSRIKLNIAVEEIFVNISTYAYPPKDGEVEIVFKIEDENVVVITFSDSGTPYNPLEKPDPDITLKAEDRPIGGLGIFMVKKSMDDMLYEFKDGKNILTLKLKF